MSFFNYLVISWALGLTGVIVYVYVRWLRRLWREYRKQRGTKPCADCDHCARLRRKSKAGYDCENVMHFFKKPPEYCSDYRPRKEQLDEEIDRRANERVNALISELVNDEMLRAWDEDLEEDLEEEVKTFCRKNSYAPVVLCKDCKNFVLRDDDDAYGVCMEIEWDIRRQTDFCSFGERREEDYVDS